MKLSTSLMIGLACGALLATNIYAQNTNKLTPAEINTLATVATIDEGEILIGEVAANKTNDASVSSLANMMIMQHSANLTQILGMANHPNALALALSHGMAQKLALQNNKDLATLGALQGSKFDLAYKDAMVSGHESALHLIDTQLMKTATSDEMKQFLTNTRATVAKHLDAAKALQKKPNS